MKWLGWVFFTIFGVIVMTGFIWAMVDMEKTSIRASECIEEYSLDSCELYKCRANNSNTIQYLHFNNRNYEICKIIINNKMNFNESLPLLETITYDN